MGSLFGGSSGSQTVTTQNKLNPTMNGLLFGDGTAAEPGFVNQYIQNLMSQPEASGLTQFGNDSNSYLGSGAALGGLANSLNVANGMLGFDQVTPTMGAASSSAASMTPAQMQAAQMQAAQGSAAQGSASQINAPSQNNLNLSGYYTNMLNGSSGNNPYLSGQIQQGIDQANDAYNNTMTNTTNNMLYNVLPSISSGAEVAGGYGGSRQGVAQGIALGQMGTAQAQAASQMGMNNQDAAANAQASTYMQGQSNALSALNNLSSNQYGTASTNAQLANQMNLANLSSANQMAMLNTQNAQQANLANSGYQQQANSTNAGYQQQAGLANSGYQQQANLANAANQQSSNAANLQSQLSTNQLNSSNALGAMSQIGNLTGQIYNYGNAQNDYPYWQTQQVTNMLSPFTGLGTSSAQTSPIYSNPVGSAIGTATSGLGLYNGLSGLLGGGSGIDALSALGGGLGSLGMGAASAGALAGIGGGLTGGLGALSSAGLIGGSADAGIGGMAALMGLI